MILMSQLITVLVMLIALIIVLTVIRLKSLDNDRKLREQNKMLNKEKSNTQEECAED